MNAKLLSIAIVATMMTAAGVAFAHGGSTSGTLSRTNPGTDVPGTPKNYCEALAPYNYATNTERLVHDFDVFGDGSTIFIASDGDGNLVGDCDGDLVVADFDRHLEHAHGGGWLLARDGLVTRSITYTNDVQGTVTGTVEGGGSIECWDDVPSDHETGSATNPLYINLTDVTAVVTGDLVLAVTSDWNRLDTAPPVDTGENGPLTDGTIPWDGTDLGAIPIVGPILALVLDLLPEIFGETPRETIEDLLDSIDSLFATGDDNRCGDGLSEPCGQFDVDAGTVGISCNPADNATLTVGTGPTTIGPTSVSFGPGADGAYNLFVGNFVIDTDLNCDLDPNGDGIPDDATCNTNPSPSVEDNLALLGHIITDQ